MATSIPDVDVRVTDGALGLIDTSAQTTTAKVGVATAGEPNRVYAFTEKETLQATLVGGPVVEAAADSLNDAGGTVLVVPVAPSIASTIGTVTRTGSTAGPTTPALTVSGTPKDGFEVVLDIVQGGPRGTASFRVATDGGDTFSPELSTPLAGAYLLEGTGLTLNFGLGTYVAGDRYAFTCTPPGFNATDLFGAFGALLADARKWKLAHIVGAPTSGTDAAKASASAALAAAVGSKMAEAAKAHRYARALVEAPDVADKALVDAYASFVDARVAIAAGYIEHLSALSGRIYKRSAAWPIATRAAKVPISQDLAWIGAPEGPLPSSVRSLYRDERKTPALDAARFVTLRTVIGRRGFFVTNPNSMAGTTSDYSLLQNGFVIDEACAASYDAMLDYLSAQIPVDAKTGRIDEVFAAAAEAKVTSKVAALVLQPRHVTALAVQINRTDNILSSKKLRWKVRCVPYAYPKVVEVEIGFVNPALVTLPPI
ncbi:MAG: hypothetical protein HYV09_03400 [Deltaproteobacteria bacterium]|nr:hypothetical protein [Deltaproteobacteria bacterium]